MSDVDPLLMLTGTAYRAAATHTDPAEIHHHAWSLVPRDCADPEAWVAGFKAAVDAIRPLLLDVARSADETAARLRRMARTQPPIFTMPRSGSDDIFMSGEVDAWVASLRNDTPDQRYRKHLARLCDIEGPRRHLDSFVLDDSPAVQVDATPLALPKFARSQPALARILGMPATARCW